MDGWVEVGRRGVDGWIEQESRVRRKWMSVKEHGREVGGDEQPEGSLLMSLSRLGTESASPCREK